MSVLKFASPPHITLLLPISPSKRSCSTVLPGVLPRFARARTKPVRRSVDWANVPERRYPMRCPNRGSFPPTENEVELFGEAVDASGVHAFRNFEISRFSSEIGRAHV